MNKNGFAYNRRKIKLEETHKLFCILFKLEFFKIIIKIISEVFVSLNIILKLCINNASNYLLIIIKLCINNTREIKLEECH